MKRDKRLSLSRILETYLEERPNRWVHGARLEKVSQSWGYEAETGKRRLRELTQRGHDRYNPRIVETYQKGAILYAYKKK